MERPDDLPERMSKEDWTKLRSVRTKLMASLKDSRFYGSRMDDDVVIDFVKREASRKFGDDATSTKINDDTWRVDFGRNHCFVVFGERPDIVPMGVIEWE